MSPLKRDEAWSFQEAHHTYDQFSLYLEDRSLDYFGVHGKVISKCQGYRPLKTCSYNGRG